MDKFTRFVCETVTKNINVGNYLEVYFRKNELLDQFYCKPININ